MSDKKYLHVNILLMRITGTFRLESENVVRRRLFLLWRITVNLAIAYVGVGSLIDLIEKGFGDFKLVIMNYVYLASGITLVMRINYCYIFDGESHGIIKEMDNAFKYKTQTGLSEIDITGYINFVNKLTWSYAILCTIVFQSLLLLAFVNGSTERSLPIPLWFPYDWKLSPYYELTLLYEIFVTEIMTLALGGIDMFFAGALILIRSQFKLLGCEIKDVLYNALLKNGAKRENVFALMHTLNNERSSRKVLGDETNSLEETGKYHFDTLLKDKEFNANLVANLNELIEFHKSLLRLYGHLNDFFSPMSLPYYIPAMFILVFFGYILIKTDDESFRIILILVLIVGQTTLFWPCFFGQILTNQAEELLKDVYESPWYMCDRKFKSNFKILQQMASKPIILTFGKFGFLSLSTFASIVKATISYVMILRKLTESEH